MLKLLFLNCWFSEVTMKLVIFLNMIYSLFPLNLPLSLPRSENGRLG